MVKYYKAKRTEFVGPKNQIIENSILIIQTLSDKKGNNRYIVEYQGALNPIKNSVIINNIFSKPDFLIEIEKPSDEFILNYVKMPNSLKIKKKNFEKLSKEFQIYRRVFATINLWVFSTKGSAAVNSKTEHEFRKDPSKILSNTLVFGDGIKSKPGSFNPNRSLRTSPIGNIEKWENDNTTLLPNGIKSQESATFTEIEKMLDKRLQELCNIHDTPENLIKRIEELFGIKKNRIHRTNYWQRKVSFFDFEKNNHHAKLKGLELCHHNPELEYSTTAENTYIGTCEENRQQGGYGLDSTWKRQLIMRIYEIDKTYEPEFLENLNLNELEKIYFTKKFR
jgi:hypothetical protein